MIHKQVELAKQDFGQQIELIREQFKDESKAALDSPILESIQSISRHHDQTGLRRLMVYSDGIRNSDVLQICVSKAHLPAFSKLTQLAQYDIIKPAGLTETQVDMLMVDSYRLPSGSYKYCSNAELRAFYPAFFEGHGACVQLTRVRYGATPLS